MHKMDDVQHTSAEDLLHIESIDQIAGFTHLIKVDGQKVGRLPRLVNALLNPLRQKWIDIDLLCKFQKSDGTGQKVIEDK